MALTTTNYNSPDCSEALDRAGMCEQELGGLIKDLREFLSNCSKDSELSKDDVVSGVREIIDGD